MDQTIIVSLGCWCGPAFAIKNMYQQQSYPFDSIRSKIEGVINNLNNDFSEFFEYSNITIINSNQNIFYCKYISFWHHNILDQNIKNMFIRRIKRLKNLTNINSHKIFIRVLQSLSELDYIIELYHSLKKYGFSNFKLYICCECQLYNYVCKLVDFPIYIYLVKNQDHITKDVHIYSQFYQSIFEFMENITNIDIPLHSIITLNEIVNKWECYMENININNSNYKLFI